jgi:epoxyqueuosine reductase QueG
VEINTWLEETFRSLLTASAENKLEDFPGVSIFDRPIMGIADGDDEIFGLFCRAVSPRHLRPRDLLEKHSARGAQLSSLRVVSWALPFSRGVRLSNRGREWPSELYSVARNNGAALLQEILLRLTRIIKNKGFRAVAPTQDGQYDAFRDPDWTFSSTWSERHVAYAAGLGRFGLNGCLITPLGTSVRLVSIVTDLSLEVSADKRASYQALCLETRGADCGICIQRCPVQAIGGNGLDKSKCHERRQAVRENFLKRYRQKFRLRPSPIVKGGKRENGFSLGCALCISGVPCESTVFPAEKP